MTYPCPCCGYLIFDEPSGSYDICEICFWEDDIVQLAFPNMDGGANKCSLIEGQACFAQYGACEQRHVDDVRSPAGVDTRDPLWRPLDPARDRYLHWGSSSDGELWDSVKNTQGVCLYYWRPEYWLKPVKT